MRDGGQQGVAQAFRLHLHDRLLGHIHIVHPLLGNSDLPGQGVQLLPLLRDQQPARLCRFERQYPAHAHRGVQGDVVPGVGRQCRGGQTGGLGIAKSPVGNGPVEVRWQQGGQGQAVVRIGQQHQGLPAKIALHGRSAELGHLFALQCCRELARQLKQRLCAALAAGGNAGLKAQPGGQLPREQAHRQHHGKGQQVLHIADRKRKAWRHEKEVKSCDVQHRRERCRAAPPLDSDQHHAQQKQHHDVGQVKVAKQRRGQQRGQHADQCGPTVTRPGSAPGGVV